MEFVFSVVDIEESLDETARAEAPICQKEMASFDPIRCRSTLNMYKATQITLEDVAHQPFNLSK